MERYAIEKEFREQEFGQFSSVTQSPTTSTVTVRKYVVPGKVKFRRPRTNKLQTSLAPFNTSFLYCPPPGGLQ